MGNFGVIVERNERYLVVGNESSLVIVSEENGRDSSISPDYYNKFSYANANSKEQTLFSFIRNSKIQLRPSIFLGFWNFPCSEDFLLKLG